MKRKELFDTAIEKGYKVYDNHILGANGDRLSLCCRGGYPTFSLRDKNGKTRTLAVHRYVAYIKFGDVIFNKGIQVRHLNSKSDDFSYSNIAIGTPSENMMDKPKEVRQRVAEIATSFIRKYDRSEVIKFYNNCKSYKKTMSNFRISSKGTLWFILNK